jgi:hypothetical protein
MVLTSVSWSVSNGLVGFLLGWLVWPNHPRLPLRLQLLENPVVANMYAVAEEILGYDLKKVVMDGPDSVLAQTIHAQPVRHRTSSRVIARHHTSSRGAPSLSSLPTARARCTFSQLAHIVT